MLLVLCFMGFLLREDVGSIHAHRSVESLVYKKPFLSYSLYTLDSMRTTIVSLPHFLLYRPQTYSVALQG